ncbi:outer membrane protein (plasmid) [Legionella adelaidensis]|uniref:Outer membrane protein n=1 Tax=Legionella adelaidensis TaxID=45056 RepID=A0A0W0R3J2_9GAMM|nr:outer membrane protein transport protein [Legionella adelaidensis]KTC65647.1 outer membrane protein [Legionella adelaidensis]VEH85157.1 outer membrane protein [Legionella adelaidensis]
MSYYYRTAILLSLVSIQSHANVVQYFTGINYSNPTEIFTTKKNQMQLGATGFRTIGRFQGSVFNFNPGDYGAGVSRTSTTSLLPYGRIATGINEKEIEGVDITEPFHSNWNWGNNSFTRYTATQTYLTDIDISPRLSYSFSKQWQVGGGLNFNFLNNNESNWAVPTSSTTYASLVNRTSSFGLGFNVGAYYLINQTNFLGAAYYSKIRQQGRGYSNLETPNNSFTFDFNMPATTVLSYVHIFNPQWLANLKLFYSEWSANQFLMFKNTAVSNPQDFTVPTQYRNSTAIAGALRRQMNDKLGLTAIGVVDDGPERDQYRVLNFPADRQYFLALAADYHFTRNTSVELLYGYGWETARMNNSPPLGPTTTPFPMGDTKLSANVVDFKLKVEAD